MKYTQTEVLQYIFENDVKFIKLFFTDIFGALKSVTIMPGELEHAFASGISFDASSVRGFRGLCNSDLFLHPDAGTLAVLPWRPQQGRVVRFLSHIRNPDGSPFAADSRHILTNTASQAASQGYTCHAGTECEFYLFEVDEQGRATGKTHDAAGYCDLAPKDKGENIRREICLTLTKMGLEPETSRHEAGPGQHEIVFRHSDICSAADNLTTFKLAVQTMVSRNGLFASFMPKPVETQSGNGLHINLSLRRGDANLFNRTPLPNEAAQFVAGILRRVREITAFLNPLRNSYQRFGGQEAPKYVCWAPLNRSQLVRIPAGSGEYARMELRSPDPSCNHYLAFSLILAAGLEGIREKLPLQEPSNFDVYSAPQESLKDLALLPQSLEEAIALAEGSAFVKAALGAPVAAAYLNAIKAAPDPQFGDL
ncbi:MAG: glutamine synthetase family protein [Treponema sp.]|jgi:glutamine synthetase|nr:glutamine synthetase family protein [Treponema sp.]